jgi:hypothetical protein
MFRLPSLAGRAKAKHIILSVFLPYYISGEGKQSAWRRKMKSCPLSFSVVIPGFGKCRVDGDYFRGYPGSRYEEPESDDFDVRLIINKYGKEITLPDDDDEKFDEMFQAILDAAGKQYAKLIEKDMLAAEEEYRDEDDNLI